MPAALDLLLRERQRLLGGAKERGRAPIEPVSSLVASLGVPRLGPRGLSNGKTNSTP